MKTRRRTLYALCLLGLAAVAALALDRLVTPSIMPLLIGAALAGTLAGAPGLFHRRVWPVAFVLLPVGGYLVARIALPLPPDVDGIGGQLGYYASRLGLAAEILAQESTPIDLARQAEVRLLMAFGIFATSGLAAFLALSNRLALAAVALFLVPLGAGVTLDGSDRAVWLPVLFLLLSGALLMLSRTLDRTHWRPGDTLVAATSAVVGAVVAVSLLATAPVAAGGPWLDWKSWGEGPDDGATSLTFDWRLNYPGLLEQEEGIAALRVTSPVPSYWRANTLDLFTGTTWRDGLSRAFPLSAYRTADETSVYDIPSPDQTTRGRTVTARFRLESISSDHILTVGTTQRLTVKRALPLRFAEDRALRSDRRLRPGFEYEITATIPEQRSSDLVGQGRSYPDEVTRYLTLPFPNAAAATSPGADRAWQAIVARTSSGEEWRPLYGLNERIVEDATDPYEIALRIERHLRSPLRYEYSLTPPETGYRSPYAAFLFETRVGYCQHFAGSMALLLRFNGIPARVALGFTAGELVDDDTYLVDTTNAHAWVEAYFPRSGWVTFDPTPGRRVPGEGASSTSSGFSDPYQEQAAAADDAAAAPEDSPAQARNAAQDDSGADTSGGSSSTTPTSTWLIWGLSTAGAAVAWPVGRAALRRRRIRGDDAEQRFHASLGAVRADLADHGVRTSPSDTLLDTARLIEEHAGLDAYAVARRAEEVLFGGERATDRDVSRVSVLRRRLRRRLRARRGWRRTLLAAYGLSVGRLAPLPQTVNDVDGRRPGR